MAGPIQSGADALMVDAADHVATALRDIAPGETVFYRRGEEMHEVEAFDPIPFGHKIAIVTIAAGERVRKYGEVIGMAVEAIPAGRHVHVHNVEGIRGRGDQAVRAGKETA